MTVRVFKENSAASAVGTNIAGDKLGRSLAPGDVISRVALVGSAAAGDSGVVFKSSTGQEIARVYNSSTGNALDTAKDWQVLETPYEVTGLGEELIVEVFDAGVTNPLYAYAEVEPGPLNGG